MVKSYDQLTPDEQDTEQWGHAAVYENNPIIPGLPGQLIHNPIIKKRVKDIQARREIDQKKHLLHENMYGGGKIGMIMQGLNMLGRGMHLIASLAGLGALVSGIVGIFMPAALPAAAVFTLISMAASGALALIQSILVGRNVYRLRKMPVAERAKVYPTLYRDIAKLLMGLLGAATAAALGFGAGSIMHGLQGLGNIHAVPSLGGAELGQHITEMAIENVGEGALATATAYTIAHQDYREVKLGKAGAFNPPRARAPLSPAAIPSRPVNPPSSPPPSPRSSVDESDDDLISSLEDQVQSAKQFNAEDKINLSNGDQALKEMEGVTAKTPSP
ncbi:MAG: hypothetical protein WCA35_18055, partial [Kovacikia sp.]